MGLITWITLSLINDTIKTVRDENIDDNDEYLNINETINQVKINSKLNLKDKANKIPKYVATPLPPLNLSQIGKMWPRKHNKEEICEYSGKNLSVNMTGIKPFNMSKIRVKRAKNFLPVLKTFVAPILPEPIFLTSSPENILVNKSPNGIEPLK